MGWKFEVIACVLFLLVLGVDADAGTIDFEGLPHGKVVNSQYFGSDGVTISVVNPNRGFGLATAFDTQFAGTTTDDDLLGAPGTPWVGGNLAPTQTPLGNVLIISENNVDDPLDTVVSDPDDEGLRPAGRFIIDFLTPIDSFGWDLVDIEGVERTGAWFGAFYSGATLIAEIPFAAFDTFAPGNIFYDASIAFGGDNTANRIAPITAAMLSALTGTAVTSFDSVQIKLGGSGAIDNLVFTSPPPIPPTAAVPLPSAAWVGMSLLAVLGFARANRRKR